MRVKVTHTMEYEEVPPFVNDLLEQCHKKLSRHASLKFNFFDVEGTIKQILDYRKDMALVDQQLEDCIGILVGYIDVPRQEEPAASEQEDEKTS